MPLNDALTAFLAEMAAQGVKPIHESTPDEVRGLTAGLAELYGTGPDMERVEDTTIPVDGESIAARILVPTSSPRGVFIYYHGGGWVIGGNIEEFDTLGRKLAARTNCAVVLVDYRLAPEHRYPVAADDSYAALEWVHAHLADIAGGTVPIIVGGDSAGGNLAAVVANRPVVPVCFQALVYPCTDARMGHHSYVENASGYSLTPSGMRWFYDHYLSGADGSPDDPRVSPLLEDDARIASAPSAIVVTAEYDPLRDEGAAYATRLAEAGVATTHVHFGGQIHGFVSMFGLLDDCRSAQAIVAEAVHTAFAKAG